MVVLFLVPMVVLDDPIEQLRKLMVAVMTTRVGSDLRVCVFAAPEYDLLEAETEFVLLIFKLKEELLG